MEPPIMVTITELPCELIAAILSNLDSLQDLVKAILTCRHFYTSFKEHPSVAGNIVLSFFDQDLLPFAVVAEQVSMLPQPRSAHVVREFVDDLTNNDRKLLSQIRSMNLWSLYSMLETEDAITDLAFDMAEHAWDEFDVPTTRQVGLSPAEAFRFFRAFYRTELFFKAFKTSPDDPDPEVVKNSQLWLITSFAQFEIEQIACVHDYLEREFIKGGLKIFTHDIKFGKMEVDYCTLGDNPWVQRWISQGAAFISRVLRRPLPLKRSLLLAALKADSSHLWTALKGQHEMFRDHKSRAALTPRDSLDPDSGPPSAFDYANMDLLLDEYDEATGECVVTTVPEEDRGLREQAYVLWDMERMKNWDLWYQMETAPETSSNYPTPAELNEMHDSWRERTEAWRKGGSGMWKLNQPKRKDERVNGPPPNMPWP